MSDRARLQARPFLKWAGGKGRLLSQLDALFPPELRRGAIHRYIEPFLGSGALFFHIAASYPVDEFFLADANPELILLYRTVQRDVEGVIAQLKGMEEAFLPLDEDGRRAYYYDVRTQLNEARADIDFAEYQPAWSERSAQLLFLNRTGYNGLFRVNGSGGFNVPFGRYPNPTICQADRLRAAAAALQRACIIRGHFAACESFVDERSFIYFDPPYRPLSRTAHFTAYSTSSFGDAEQLELAQLYRQLDQRGAKLMLSNSDPQNTNPADTFFEEAFRGFRIERIRAGRRINSRVAGRGAINELVILNWWEGESWPQPADHRRPTADR